MKDQITILRETIQKLHAIEVLEYLDKNHLSGSNESRSKEKQELLIRCLDKIDTIDEQSK